ncbi:hypothetical protein SIO70_33185 [Chitinophaga sancti]|uniref:hypothetical protein n=1 Tax=Chitinophaga sancti TaxID=1004 RepID=UPI002A762BDE|nr:hypothetical protein [Chitinophaga sancti]WPQ63226.1 hypothetical protein SIO70_33185 [Chitinophaga sancti]
MKTSIKLLLFFVGIVLLLVLASDVVLWAYFKKGINGDGTVLRFPKKGDNAEVAQMTVLQPFKAIVINTNNVRIMYDKENRIGNLGGESEVPSNYYKQVGDTLYILPGEGDGISVYCKSVPYIRLAKDSLHVEIATLKQPSLEVTGLDDCYVEMSGVEIENFTYNGGKNNKVSTRERGNFDTMNVQLGWYGSVYLQDVTVKNFSVKADSMRALKVDEIGLSQLTQFKRN